MPIFSVRNNETEEVSTVMLTWDRLQEYLAANPNLEQIITSAPAIGDAMRLGRKKTDSRHRDKIAAIKKNHRGSKIRTGNLSAV